MISQKYIQIFDAIYNLSDFSQILLNPNDDNTFLQYKKVFQTVIEFRGSEDKPTEKTIYGLKPLIFTILDELSENVRELNNNIIALKNKIEILLVKIMI